MKCLAIGQHHVVIEDAVLGAFCEAHLHLAHRRLGEHDAVLLGDARAEACGPPGKVTVIGEERTHHGRCAVDEARDVSCWPAHGRMIDQRMPELPEVETVCRTMRAALQGRRITEVEVVHDSVVFGEASPKTIEKALLGRTVKAVGRRGKFFWLCLSGEGPTLFGHLGMSGWIREVGLDGVRLHGHGDAPFEDEHGRPRFMKLGVATRSGRGIVMTDPRRLGRVWLGSTPEQDRRVKRLGPDAFDALPPGKELIALFARRKIPIKALLLDQSTLAGIGNWIADEVLYQSRIAPKRAAASLTPAEVAALRRAIVSVLARAVKVGADHKKYPNSWLFERRWGGRRGAEQVGGQRIVREEVGGRTTAWVPTRQR